MGSKCFVSISCFGMLSEAFFNSNLGIIEDKP